MDKHKIGTIVHVQITIEILFEQTIKSKNTCTYKSSKQKRNYTFVVEHWAPRFSVRQDYASILRLCDIQGLNK